VVIPRARSTGLLLAGVGVLVLCRPPASTAAEAPAPENTATVPSTQPETGSSSTAAPPAPTLTVEPAPTPPPAPSPAPPAPAPAPRVRVQRPQSSTSHARAGTPNERSGRSSTNSGVKLGSGPRAPSPSALTPALPLAFSTSLSGIPTFFIESFRVPPFLLPIYQAAGTAYGVPWQVLAAINEVETDYGRDLSVSSAGAEGWMQFLPSSWAIYGVDANGDGFKDPYNPADAIFAAARYLRAAGATGDLRGAIFAYNHSNAYVETVLLRARLLGGTPSDLLGALTGLTQGRFPVHAPAHFSDGFLAAPAGSGPARALPGTTIYSQPAAPVIAVQDGLVARIGDSPQLGRFIALRDAYGNTYTYAQLGRLARLYPVLQPHEGAGATPSAGGSSQQPEPRPIAPASAGVQPRAQAPLDEGAALSGIPGAAAGLGAPSAQAGASAAASPSANPGTPAPAAFRAGPNDVYLHPLRAGVRVIAGTVLGHLDGAAASAQAGEGAHMFFQIRPSGAGAPMIDPKPILDGWVQLENTSLYRAGGANPFLASEPSPGQALLESKQQLEQQVLSSRAIAAGRCARQDIQAGRVDRRVLATLEFLAASGLRPSVSGLGCASASSGAAGASEQTLQIVAVNGAALAGARGSEVIAQSTLAKLRALQGPMKPFALGTRAAGIEVSFAQPVIKSGHIAGVLSGGVTPSQWIQLIARLGEIPSPTVRSGPSAASIPDRVGERAAPAGEASGNR
jgi:hypothetical protein